MILVTGANGFVGHKILEMCKDTIAAPSLRNATQEEIKRMIETSNAIRRTNGLFTLKAYAKGDITTAGPVRCLFRIRLIIHVPVRVGKTPQDSGISQFLGAGEYPL